LAAPQRYLDLLSLAENHKPLRPLIADVLERAAPAAYLDVDEPFGPTGLVDWLAELLNPDTWERFPQWVFAIEDRLFCLVDSTNPTWN